MALWVTRLDVVNVNVLRQFYWFLAEIADESVLPYVGDYLPTLFLIVRTVKYFLFCFPFRIVITLEVASLRQLPLMGRAVCPAR